MPRKRADSGPLATPGRPAADLPGARDREADTYERLTPGPADTYEAVLALAATGEDTPAAAA